MIGLGRVWRGIALGAGLLTGTGAVLPAQTSEKPRLVQVVPARLTARAGDNLDAGLVVAVGADAPGPASMVVDGVGVLRDGFVTRGYPAPQLVCPQRSCVPCPPGLQCFVTGTQPIDPRTPPGRYAVPVAFTDALGRSARATIELEVTPALDADADGLPDVWEALYHLSTTSAIGDDGPDGDPDGDGIRNRDELGAGTAPRGRYQRYFAEASAGDRPPGVTSCFVIAAPQGESGAGWLTLIGDDNRRAVTSLGYGRAAGYECALHPAFHPADRIVAAIVETEQPAIVSRSVRGLASYGVAAPSSRWLFADGGTDGILDTFYLAYNPNPDPVVARFTYRLPSGEIALQHDRELPPGHRTTVWVNADEVALGRREASVEVSATAPILLERAWRFDPPGRTATQPSATPGTAAASARWYFGEIDASLPFDTSLVVANPDTRPALVTISLLFDDRDAIRVGPIRIPRGGRVAYPASQMGALGGRAAAVEVLSTNGIPVVAERSWSGRDASGPWREASAGATETGAQWTVADTVGSDTIVIVNPSTAAARVRLDFTVQSQSGNDDSTTIVEVPPRQRLAYPFWRDPRVQTTGTLRLTSLQNRDGTVAPIVVERVYHAPNATVPRLRPWLQTGSRVR